MAVRNVLEIRMWSAERSMCLPCAHYVFPAELKDYFSGANGADDVCIDIRNRIAGDFERERPSPRVSIILAEFLKVIGYLTINVGQTHIRS